MTRCRVCGASLEGGTARTLYEATRTRRCPPSELAAVGSIRGGSRQRGGAGEASRLIGAAAGEPALSRDRGRDQVAVLLDAQDLSGGLAYEGCAAVDPDHPVVVGKLGDAEPLLVGQRQCLHSCAPLSHPTVCRTLGAREQGTPANCAQCSSPAEIARASQAAAPPPGHREE